MNIKLLESFYHVVIEESFIKAAKKLSVSQPAISSSIKKLEEQLSANLLERSNRGIILTPTGERIFESCKLIFLELDNLEYDLGVDNDVVKGPLKIGTSDEIASYLLANKLKHLKEEFPLTTPEIYTAPAAELLEKLKDGELDLLILFYTPSLPEGISERSLFNIRFKGVIKKNLKNKKEILNKLIGDKIIFPSHKKKFSALKKHLKANKESKFCISTNNINMHLQMALQGEGITFLPEFIVNPLIKSGKLVVLHPSEKDYYSLKVVMRNSFVPNKAYKKLIELISPS